MAVTDEIVAEYSLACIGMRAKRSHQNHVGPLAWVLSRAAYFDPAPLGKQRSRDVKDDPFLACALSARADYLVTNDRDLLDLGKPFGISVVTPAEFLKVVDQTRT